MEHCAVDDHIIKKDFSSSLECLKHLICNENNINFHFQTYISGFLQVLDTIPDHHEKDFHKQLLHLCMNINYIKIAQNNNCMVKLTKLIDLMMNFKTDEKKITSIHSTSKNWESTIHGEPHKINNVLETIKENPSEENKDTFLNFNVLPKRYIGKMKIPTRVKKIIKYKLKIFRRRTNVPLIRKFNGRSVIAKKKVRCKGRFVKQAKKIFSVSMKK